MKRPFAALYFDIAASLPMVLMFAYFNLPWWAYLVALICGTVMNHGRSIGEGR